MLQSMVYLPLRKMKVEDIFDAELPCFPRLLIQLTPVCLVVSVCVCVCTVLAQGQHRFLDIVYFPQRGFDSQVAGAPHP